MAGPFFSSFGPWFFRGHHTSLVLQRNGVGVFASLTPQCDNHSRCGRSFHRRCLRRIKAMKHLLVCAGLVFAATTVLAQQQTPATIPGANASATAPKKAPASPPEKATGTIGGHEISITYSSPAVKGREGKIFTKDGLISHNPHYPVWRAGANAATTLETNGDLMIGDLHVPAGKYTLFVDISDPDQWTLIVNKKTGEWGLAYDGTQDLGKTKMKMSKPSSMVENLKWDVKADGGKGTITLAWENQQASVPVTAHK
jgi:hypothetical protein